MFKTASAIVVAVLALSTAGCRHYCGYVGQHMVIQTAGDGETVESRPAPDPMVIEQLLPPGSAALVVRVEGLEVATAMADCALYGRETFVEWRWYSPLVKPLVVISLFGPFYASAFDPHAHSSGNWGMLDYLQDVGSWYNFVSAVPSGPREVEDEETLIRSERRMTTTRVSRTPLAGRKVTLAIGEKTIAAATSDEKGRVRFDLDAWIRSRADWDDHAARLEMTEPERSVLTVMIRNAAIMQYVNERDKVLPIR